jgi:hypothetical protein
MILCVLKEENRKKSFLLKVLKLNIYIFNSKDSVQSFTGKAFVGISRSRIEYKLP